VTGRDRDDAPEAMNASDVRSFFEATAAEWDTMRLTYYDERVIETMADAIGVDGRQTVLDVGTGTGFVAAGLASRAERVIALDNSPAMLEFARDNLAQLGADNVELREGDLGELPLEDDSMDAAVANMVLHHAQDPAAMIAEMARGPVRIGGSSNCSFKETLWNPFCTTLLVIDARRRRCLAFTGTGRRGTRVSGGARSPRQRRPSTRGRDGPVGVVAARGVDGDPGSASGWGAAVCDPWCDCGAGLGAIGGA